MIDYGGAVAESFDPEVTVLYFKVYWMCVEADIC